MGLEGLQTAVIGRRRGLLPTGRGTASVGRRPAKTTRRRTETTRRSAEAAGTGPPVLPGELLCRLPLRFRQDRHHLFMGLLMGAAHGLSQRLEISALLC